MGSKRIQVLSEIDVNRLTAAVIVPSFADVYLGLLHNCISLKILLMGRYGCQRDVN